MKKLITTLAIVLSLVACTDAKSKSCIDGPAAEDINDLRSQVAEADAILKECGGRDRSLEGLAILTGVTVYLQARSDAHKISTAEGRLLTKIMAITARSGHYCDDVAASEEGPEGP
jgi:hypothetical protein